MKVRGHVQPGGDLPKVGDVMPIGDGLGRVVRVDVWRRTFDCETSHETWAAVKNLKKEQA